MAAFIGVLTATALLSVAGVHAYWARGGYWPAPDRDHLAETVVGPGQPFPSIWATWSVAGLLLAAAVLVAGTGLGVDRWIFRTGAAVVAAVLALRAVAGFAVSGVVRPESTFARLDIRYFSPLCLALALGAFLATF